MENLRILAWAITMAKTFLPQLNIPPSNYTVNVSVIGSTARIRVPMAAFVKDLILGHEFLECPAYVFLVEHSTGSKVLFDLGFRKDIDGFPPAILNVIERGIKIEVENDIASIIQNDGRITLDEINAIIWRYVMYPGLYV
jgi:hypothetical protein